MTQEEQQPGVGERYIIAPCVSNSLPLYRIIWSRCDKDQKAQCVTARYVGIQDGRVHIGQYIVPAISTPEQPFKVFISFMNRSVQRLRQQEQAQEDTPNDNADFNCRNRDNLYVISGFRRGVNYTFAFQGCYAAQICIIFFCRLFWTVISRLAIFLDCLTPKMGPIVCPEMS